MFSNPENLISYPLQKRRSKPRQKGMTMVIDRGLGLRELEDLLETAGAYLDFLKLGFGTSLLYQPELLEAKIKLCQNFQVEIYPGGTLTEIALIQGEYPRYLRQAHRLGFQTLEISDGIITLTASQRETCLKKALALDFKVLSELGKKNTKDTFSPQKIWQQGQEDLKNGAWKIIIEARESGQGIGIYNQKGEIRKTRLQKLLQYFPDPATLIWEAPLKKQQIALIHKLGPEVNLGNIQPADLFALEALRTGLRADTLSLNPNFSTEICSL